MGVGSGRLGQEKVVAMAEWGESNIRGVSDSPSGFSSVCMVRPDLRYIWGGGEGNGSDF